MERINERHMGRRVRIARYCNRYADGIDPTEIEEDGRIIDIDRMIRMFHFIPHGSRHYDRLTTFLWRITKVY